MPEPMSDERLAELEARHQQQIGRCSSCGYEDAFGAWRAEEWPCESMELIAEVRRLRAQLALNESDVLPDAIVREVNGERAYYRRMCPNERVITMPGGTTVTKNDGGAFTIGGPMTVTGTTGAPPE